MDNNITTPIIVNSISLFNKIRDNDCAICLDTFGACFSGREVREEDLIVMKIIKTECDHYFDFECLITLRKIKKNQFICPLCRNPLKETSKLLKRIELDQAIQKNRPKVVQKLIKDLLRDDPDIKSVLKSSFSKAFKASVNQNRFKNAQLWLELGASRDLNHLNIKLKDAVSKMDKGLAQALIKIGAEPADPETAKSILRFAASTNDPSLAKKCIAWWYTKLGMKVDKDILGQGLKNAANNDDIQSAEEWIQLGATRCVEYMNTGLMKSAENDDPRKAKKWIEMGAEKDITVLIKGYKNADITHKHLWEQLGAKPGDDVLMLDLENAITGSHPNPIKVMALIKRIKAAIKPEVLEKAKANAENADRPQLWENLIKLLEKHNKKYM